MNGLRIATSLVLVLFFAGPAFCQTLYVKERIANLHSSPSLTGSIVLLQIPRNYPLDVQDERGNFLYVSDYQGRRGWVAKSVVCSVTGVIVNVSMLNVRSGPGEKHEVLFKARRGVTFRVLQDQQDWLNVEHESGRKGWIYKELVWGLKSSA